MKFCEKCGKVVANSALECPQCGSRMFNTDNGVEGVGADILQTLLNRYPVLVIPLGIIAVGLIIAIIVFLANF